MFKEKFLPVERKEAEKNVETKVVLEFMRHGKKEIDPSKSDDREIRLSEEGRKMADEKGEKINPDAKISVAWGSPRKRTQETSGRAMFAGENLPQDASLEEMNGMIEEKFQNEQMLDKDYPYGVKSKKIIEDERLGFNAHGPVGKEEDDAPNFFQYIVDKSDSRAVELGDKESSTYLRYAGNIFEILQRYIKIGNNFNKLVSKSNGSEEYGNRLERYLGSHQGVLEPFILKILEKTQGKEKRNEYIKAIGDGFHETHGFRVEITNNGGDQKILLTYETPNNNGDDSKEETLEIDKKLIEEIIEERNEFEEKVATNGKE